MPGKRTQPSKALPKSRSSASTKVKPSLLGLKPPTKGKKGTHKARDADVREKLDGDREALRAALEGPKKKALVEKKEAPAELAQGGDTLAKSMDVVLADLLGAA